LWQVRGWPRQRDQLRAPLRIKWQQTLAHRLVASRGLRAVVKNVNLGVLALGSARFAFDLDLAHERGNGADRAWDRELPRKRQACVMQLRSHPLTDGPDELLPPLLATGMPRATP
jgi:hypothetical protein